MRISIVRHWAWMSDAFIDPHIPIKFTVLNYDFDICLALYRDIMKGWLEMWMVLTVVACKTWKGGKEAIPMNYVP